MRLSCRLKDYVKGIQQLIKHDLNILEKDKYIVKIRSGNGGAGLSRYYLVSTFYLFINFLGLMAVVGEEGVFSLFLFKICPSHILKNHLGNR